MSSCPSSFRHSLANDLVGLSHIRQASFTAFGEVNYRRFPQQLVLIYCLSSFMYPRSNREVTIRARTFSSP